MAYHNDHDESMAALQDQLRSVTVSPAVQPNPNPTPVTTLPTPDPNAVIYESYDGVEFHSCPRPRFERTRSMPADLETFGDTHGNTHLSAHFPLHTDACVFSGPGFGEEAPNMSISLTGTTVTGGGGAAATSGYFMPTTWGPYSCYTPGLNYCTPSLKGLLNDQKHAQRHAQGHAQMMHPNGAFASSYKSQNKVTKTTPHTQHVGSRSKVRRGGFSHAVAMPTDDDLQIPKRGKAGSGELAAARSKRRPLPIRLHPHAWTREVEDKFEKKVDKGVLRARRLELMTRSTNPAIAESKFPLETTSGAMELDGQNSTSQQEVDMGHTSLIDGNNGHVSNTDHMGVEDEDSESKWSIQGNNGFQFRDVQMDEELYSSFYQQLLGGLQDSSSPCSSDYR
ncbi:hypothetical protein QBC45DRAFT_334172 [Copromyces sp. CBS 386.78]|nr:hypothetical protein QBC45DRAFT_334172 [Copromyces sp. CBS 386.78]